MMKQLLSDMLAEEEATIAIELQQKTFGPLLVQAETRARLLRQLLATCKPSPRPDWVEPDIDYTKETNV